MKKILWITLAILILVIMALSRTTGGQEAEKEAIIQTGLDYGDGFYSGDAARMERALHPDLNKAWAMPLPKSGKVVLQYSTFSGLVEMSRAKVGYLAEEKRKATVTVLEIMDDVACAKLTSARYNDYLAMVKVDGRWKIVNVLWTPGPDVSDRPAPAGFDPEKEKDAAKAAVGDYYQGRFTGNVEFLEKTVHPELRLAQIATLPQTGKTIINRIGRGVIIEAARAGLNLPPEGNRKVEIKALDLMDGMAFVEAVTPTGAGFLQLQLMEGRWKIIIILIKPKSVPPTPQK
jgi:hypothetical protein